MPRWVVSSLPFLRVVVFGIALWGAPIPASASPPPRYRPSGMDAWDYWFARVDGVFHAFYLQSPVDAPTRFSTPTIGMARSSDLLHWTEYGQVIAANPTGPWSDAFVATGSTWRGPDHWMMAFTGVSRSGLRGIGIATSDDLEHWTKVGNDGPAPITHHGFVVPQAAYWQDRGFTAGQVLDYTFIADPYVLPDPIDGWYYMVVSGHLGGPAIDYRGCTALLRSSDGLAWEDVGIISAPRRYEECEVPQLWRHGDRWYLMFGAARANPFYRATIVCTASTIHGPFEPTPSPEITVPEPGWFYVGKVFPDMNGQDVLMAYVSGALSLPHLVNYQYDGSVWIGPRDAGAPGAVPTASYVGQVAPNPMLDHLSIEYGLARTGHVSIAVYDVAGRRVRDLVRGTMPAGVSHARWEARDDRNRRMPAGVYLFRFVAEDIQRTWRIVIGN